MNCKYCNTVNDEDAVYCIQCGKKLDGKLICPSCGSENEDDATFCEKCGKKLVKTEHKNPSTSKEKGIKLTNFIFQIVSVSMSAFTILFCFGACFAPFMTLMGKGINLFDFIKQIQEVRLKPAGTYGADFYFLGTQLPNIICLCGICIALVGCFVSILCGSIKAIRFGKKKQIPNLDNIALLSTCSLLLGMLFISLSFISYNSSSELISSNYSIGYGAIVLSAVSIGLSWYFLNYIAHFVLDLIQGLAKKEVINQAFKLGELVLLCVILFNLGSSFIVFVQKETSWIGSNAGTISTGMSVVSFFANLSSSIYSKTTDMTFIFADSKVAGGYYLAMALFIIFLVIVVAGLCLIWLRFKDNKKEKKASIGISSALVGMALVEFILTIVAKNVFAKAGGVLEFLYPVHYEDVKISIGSSIIVFTVFAFLLLALEIAWVVISKEMKDSKEQEEHAM